MIRRIHDLNWEVSRLVERPVKPLVVLKGRFFSPHTGHEIGKVGIDNHNPIIYRQGIDVFDSFIHGANVNKNAIIFK